MTAVMAPVTRCRRNIIKYYTIIRTWNRTLHNARYYDDHTTREVRIYSESERKKQLKYYAFMPIENIFENYYTFDPERRLASKRFFF